MAGGEITTAACRTLEVSYKGRDKAFSAPTDPVSDVDRRVELRIREQLGRSYPTHGIIGEEIDQADGTERDFVWVVDPVDGTTNFINGFPLFAASIGVLYRGCPAVGAIWCSTGHALRSGVYHAHRGGALRFDGEILERSSREGVERRLIGDPGGSPRRMEWWDNRVTGSAAIECAFVAADLLVGARFRPVSIWDVAAGVVLMAAAECEIWVEQDDDWAPFERFEAPATRAGGQRPTLRDWRCALIAGTPKAAAALRKTVGAD
jgi:myo-inositol-1(or 4)-monophosphatase